MQFSIGECEMSILNHDAVTSFPVLCRKYGIQAIADYLDKSADSGEALDAGEMNDLFPLTDAEYEEPERIYHQGVMNYLSQIPDDCLRHDALTGHALLEMQLLAFA
jgi:hypothetical protein